MSLTGNVLVRSGKLPFVRASGVEVLKRNLTLSNTGNLLFQHAFMRHLYSPDLNIVSVQDGPFTDQDAQRINQNFDAIYLPFANAFRATFQGGLKNWISLLKKIKI